MWRVEYQTHGSISERLNIPDTFRPLWRGFQRKFREIFVQREYHYTRLRTSVTLPVIAAAAALNGLAKNVLDFGPCLPSKFRFDVLIQYLPAGILSSFIPKHAEHPG